MWNVTNIIVHPFICISGLIHNNSSRSCNINCCCNHTSSMDWVTKRQIRSTTYTLKCHFDSIFHLNSDFNIFQDTTEWTWWRYREPLQTYGTTLSHAIWNPVPDSHTNIKNRVIVSFIMLYLQHNKHSLKCTWHWTT